MNEQFQIKDKLFDLISSNPSRDGFAEFFKATCGELDNIDFKRNWIDKGKLAKIVLAMANSGGGVIVIGVSENKKEKKYEAVGIENIKDPADIEKEISKYVPRNVDYTVLTFDYNSKIYGDFSGKKFQTVIIRDTPERLPFFSLNTTTDLEKDTIYIRRGTSSVKANASDMELMIQRKLDNVYKESSNLSLGEHMEQLRFLYDSIPKTKRILVKRGNQYTGALAGIRVLQERMSEILGGEPDVYEDIPNENYPEEEFEEFLVRMIEQKKLKIEKVLDLK